MQDQFGNNINPSNLIDIINKDDIKLFKEKELIIIEFSKSKFMHICHKCLKSINLGSNGFEIHNKYDILIEYYHYNCFNDLIKKRKF